MNSFICTGSFAIRADYVIRSGPTRLNAKNILEAIDHMFNLLNNKLFILLLRGSRSIRLSCSNSSIIDIIYLKERRLLTSILTSIFSPITDHVIIHLLKNLRNISLDRIVHFAALHLFVRCIWSRCSLGFQFSYNPRCIQSYS